MDMDNNMMNMDENLEMNFDFNAFFTDNDVIPENVSNEKLREANKRLPKWNIVPKMHYKED